jgi:hypothetical protein
MAGVIKANGETAKAHDLSFIYNLLPELWAYA